MGWRLIRSQDLERERGKADAAERAAADAAERERDLLRDLADLQGKLQAALTHADFVTTRVNVLEHEVAQFRQLAQPQVNQMVPAIGKRPVVAAAYDGAGADLFEDVGDQEAERLRRAGLLHDAPADPIAAVSTGALAPDFQ